MRLLNVQTLKLETFFGTQPPRYAILSHTWEQEELLYTDLQDPAAPFPSHKRGAHKVIQSCRMARLHKLEYIWIDTCCIDKTSSAELSESINTMFAWYRNAEICFAYLADVDVKVPVERSRWFTRGWTLQELIAPERVTFYDKWWLEIGWRESDPNKPFNSSFLDILTHVTGIPSSLLCRNGGGPCVLRAPFELSIPEDQHEMRLYNGICQVCFRKDTFPTFLKERFSNAQKMSWAARRVTTRREDQAYCLLGLFGVSMPLLYGEGDMAFMRLQEEIMRNSDDPSLLAFDYFKPERPWKFGEVGLLAPFACLFENSPIRLPRSMRMQTINRMTVDSKTISLRMFLCPDDGRSSSRFWLGILPSCYEHDLAARPALLLESVSQDNTVFSRVFVKEITVRPVATEMRVEERSIYGQAVDANFKLLDARLEDIRIIRKKPIKPVSMIPPLRESPAVRIFIQKGITLVRVYPDNLGHEMVQMSPELPEADIIMVTINTDGTMIYIPARERGQYTTGKWGIAQDYTSGVLCLQAKGDTRPFYVLFYGYRPLYPSIVDDFKGVFGRAVVQVDLKPENGDPASPKAMEAALVAEGRMQKESMSSSEHGKRVVFRRVKFLDQILLELIVEADVKDPEIKKDELV